MSMICIEWDATLAVDSKAWDNDGGWVYTLRGTSWNTTQSQCDHVVSDTKAVAVKVFSKGLALFAMKRFHLDDEFTNLEAVTGHSLLSPETGYTWIERRKDETRINVALGTANNSPVQSILDDAMISESLAVGLHVRFDVQPDEKGSRTESVWIQDYEFGTEVFASGPPQFLLVRAQKNEC